MKRKQIFIIGMPHSGTNWVNQWLSRHPLIQGSKETHVISQLLSFRQTEEQNRSIRRFILESMKATKHGLVFDNSLMVFGRGLGLIFPEAYFLVFHRDGRRIAASLKKRMGTSGCQRWSRYANMILADDIPEQTLVTKYSDLCEDPSSSQKITEFLGVEHHGNIDLGNFINCSFGRRMPEDHWKTFLNEKEKSEFTTIQGALTRLGYF